jgi:hypothetical protein
MAMELACEAATHLRSSEVAAHAGAVEAAQLTPPAWPCPKR